MRIVRGSIRILNQVNSIMTYVVGIHAVEGGDEGGQRAFSRKVDRSKVIVQLFYVEVLINL